jgi:hypothetical protein
MKPTFQVRTDRLFTVKSSLGKWCYFWLINISSQRTVWVILSDDFMREALSQTKPVEQSPRANFEFNSTKHYERFTIIASARGLVVNEHREGLKGTASQSSAILLGGVYGLEFSSHIA